MLYYFKKGENTTEMQNIFVQFMEKVLWLIEWIRSSLQNFLLDNAARLGRPVEVDNNQIETLIENNQCSTMQGIASILKISKSIVIGENEKCVFYLTEKWNRLFGHPNIKGLLRAKSGAQC